jgi:hypothetical protein
MADDEAVDQDEQSADATGGDSAEGKAEQREESDPAAGGGGDDERSEESAKAQEKEEQREQAKEKMKEIEEDPPADIADWPDDAAKYETFGGAEGEHSYDEGPETKLGPSSLRHREGGEVEIEGEKVDDPDEYKGSPIPGGPTDEDAAQDLTAERIRDEQGRGSEGEGGGDSADSSDDGDKEEAEQSS